MQNDHNGSREEEETKAAFLKNSIFLSLEIINH